eukprot:8240231-Alexandrium_andersonii.AAC.1
MSASLVGSEMCIRDRSGSQAPEASTLTPCRACGARAHPWRCWSTCLASSNPASPRRRSMGEWTPWIAFGASWCGA